MKVERQGKNKMFGMKKKKTQEEVFKLSADKFPKQGNYFRKQVDVFFDVGAAESIRGVVVRNDVEPPHVTVIRLINGRHVLGSECALYMAVR